MSAALQYVVVAGIDFSELANRALDHALLMAATHDNAEVHVVYVEPDVWIGGPFGGPLTSAVNADEILTQVQTRASERVKALEGKLDSKKLVRVVAHYRRGAAGEQIAQLAADLDADLVVVGSHGHRGLQRILLGSVAERVARLARCPVWIVRPKDHSVEEKVPAIEPPCPDCVKRRTETNGAELWCARHSEHHIRPHRYSYTSTGIYSAETTAYESSPER